MIFEKTGYTRQNNRNTHIRFVKFDCDGRKWTHTFNIKKKTYQKRVDDGPQTVTADELKAVFEVCRELGWI